MVKEHSNTFSPLQAPESNGSAAINPPSNKPGHQETACFDMFSCSSCSYVKFYRTGVQLGLGGKNQPA